MLDPKPTLNDGTNSRDRSDGDRLEQAYIEHRHELIAFLKRQFGNGPPDPEDMSQLAFEKLLRRDSLDGIESIRAFLWSTARNLTISSLRRHKVRGNYDFEIEQLYFAVPGDEKSPARVVEVRDQLAIIGDTLAQMPESRRQAFIMHKVEGLNRAEIARRLGISPTAVFKRLARAAAEIDAALESHRTCK